MPTEIAEGIQRIETVFGGRALYLYLLRGSDRTLLVDAGAATTAQTAILPLLAAEGIIPDLVLISHPDVDHQGGAHRLLQAFPHLSIACGAADIALVSDPLQLVERRYSHYEVGYGIGFTPAEKAAMFVDAGRWPIPIHQVYSGGEKIWLSPDWFVEVLHLPGHSHGHLGIYDPRSQIAIIQDAVQGRDYPFADGQPWALMPTYLYVDSYIATIRFLRQLPLTALHTAHWPSCAGHQIAAFLDTSLEYCCTVDRLIYDCLAAFPGCSLQETIERVAPELGEWPREIHINFMFSFAGHLDRLVAANIVRSELDGGIYRYTAVRPYQPPVFSSSCS